MAIYTVIITATCLVVNLQVCINRRKFHDNLLNQSYAGTSSHDPFTSLDLNNTSCTQSFMMTMDKYANVQECVSQKFTWHWLRNYLHTFSKWLSFNTETVWQQRLIQKLFGRGATDFYAERGNDDLRCAGEMFTTFNTLIKTFLKHYQDIGFDYVCQVCNSFLRIDMMKKEWKSMRGIISRIQRKRRKMWQLRKFQTYVPRGTLRSSQNHHLSKRFCDRVLFDYVSFTYSITARNQSVCIDNWSNQRS